MRHDSKRSSHLGVTLSPRSVYALGAAGLVTAVAIPFIARWQGLLHGPIPPAEAREIVSVRPELLRLPGGEFWMGSPEGEKDRDDDEGPRHRVKVSSFELCRTEVTQGQWKAVMGTKPSDCEYGCGDDKPVQNVSWRDAIRYMNELTKVEMGKEDECYEMEGEGVRWKEGCKGYRLPTEAEWEYGARAGTETAYGFGEDESKLGEYAWWDGNSENKVHEVGGRKANRWFLHDMHGNVWEWVWDWYGPYKQGKEAEQDPVGPSEEEARIVDTYDLIDGEIKPMKGKARLLRGGAFGFWAGDLRSADRGGFRPGDRYVNVGFRCARGVAQPRALEGSSP